MARSKQMDIAESRIDPELQCAKWIFIRSEFRADLSEHAVLIANAIAPGRQVQGGHGVQEAGCQAAKAPIAQSRISLLLDEILHSIAHVSHRLRVLQGMPRTSDQGVNTTHSSCEGRYLASEFMQAEDPVSRIQSIISVPIAFPDLSY